MGIGNSQEWSGQRQERRPLPHGYGHQGGKKKRRGFFRRRKPVLTRQFGTYRPFYGPCLGGPQSAYSPVQPILSPFSYNNYAAPSYMPSQPLMMQPQRVAPFMVPPPSMGMPMSAPYVQQPPPQVHPAYNYNIGASAPMPMGMSGGTRFYPPSYPSAPVRFLTDWTGGGKISPGFLGPPI